VPVEVFTIVRIERPNEREVGFNAEKVTNVGRFVVRLRRVCETRDVVRRVQLRRCRASVRRRVTNVDKRIPETELSAKYIEQLPSPNFEQGYREHVLGTRTI
jgi:hypothetical protein